MRSEAATCDSRSPNVVTILEILLIHTISSSCRPQHQGTPVRHRPRALGAALEAALYLARGPALEGGEAPVQPGVSGRPSPPGRVVLIATGPSTVVSARLSHSRPFSLND